MTQSLDLDAVCRKLLRLKPMRFLSAQFARNGDTFATDLPDGSRRIATCCPEVTLLMLQKKADHFVRIDSPLQPILLDGLLIIDGPLWKHRRSALQPVFRRPVMEALRPALCAALERFLADVQPGRIEDFYDVCRQLVLRVTVETLFATDAYDPALLDVLADTMALSGPERIQGVMERDPAVWERIKIALDHHVEHILDASGRQPFLDGLFESGLTRDELAVELRSVLLGGQDTLSSVLLWATRLRSEQAVPSPVDRVVSETLRLHTPLYAYPRRCVTTTDLNNGFVAEPGDEVVVWVHVLHRAAKWWPDPLRFDPDRFLQRPHPGTYLPFSLGYHNCLGRHFGRLLLEEALTHLEAYGFQWESPPPPCVPLITMHPTRAVPVVLSRSS